MTDKQPEALRLAALLDATHFSEHTHPAAEELRRLHAQNIELLGALNLAAEQLIENGRVVAYATIVDALVKAEADHD